MPRVDKSRRPTGGPPAWFILIVAVIALPLLVVLTVLIRSEWEQGKHSIDFVNATHRADSVVIEIGGDQERSVTVSSPRAEVQCRGDIVIRTLRINDAGGERIVEVNQRVPAGTRCRLYLKNDLTVDADFDYDYHM